MPLIMYGIFLIFIPLFLQLILLHFLAKLLDRLFYERFGRTFYLLFMWPGVAVHELSHLAACLVTLTRVREVKLFAPRDERSGTLTLGWVTHDRPRSPVISTLIGSAPFFGGAAALWLLLHWLFPAVLQQADLRPLVWNGGWSGALDLLVGSVSAYVSLAMAVFAHLAGGGWRTAVFLIAATSLAAHAAPSKTDLRHTVIGLVAVFILLLVLVLVGGRLDPAWPQRLAAFLPRPIGAVSVLLGYGLVCVGSSLAVFGGLAAILSGLRRLRRLRPRRGQTGL